MPNRPTTRSQTGTPLFNMVAEVGRRVRTRGSPRGRILPEESPTRESIDQSMERVPEVVAMADLNNNNQTSSPVMLNSSLVIATDQANLAIPMRQSSATNATNAI